MYQSIENDLWEHVHDQKHADMLNHRYEKTQAFFSAVLCGDADAATELFCFGAAQVREVNQIYSPQDNSLQQSRHRLVSCNAILSLGANMAGVYPLYIHSLVRRYDAKICVLPLISQEDALAKEMIENYCLLIRQVGVESSCEFSRKVLHLLYAHLLDPVSIKDLSQEMYVAPATLCRKFKAETGITIKSAMNEQRIRLAQLYIQEGDTSITSVAYRVGFRDVSYFNKVFYRYTGRHPKEYRTEIRRMQNARDENTADQVR